MPIKRLYIFLLKDYLLSFLATFLVCIFILLMQSLWRYIDVLVGKGLELTVLAQFFWYAAISIVPMALPLSILLSSLMAFGSMGERLELIAMKAAGISLMRIMKPYLVLIGFMSIASFYFSNVVLPDAQLKWTVLLRSIKYKSPDVSVPVGSFYTGIDNYSIYVRSKNHDTKMMYDMMIYDFTGTGSSSNTENIRIVAADSGMLVSTADKKGFILKLHNGVLFENIKKSQMNTNSKNAPFRRETFTYRELVMDYDNNLSLVSEESVSNKQSTKNLSELSETIDSLQAVSDSLCRVYASNYVETKYFGRKRDSLAAYTDLDAVPEAHRLSYKECIEHRTKHELKESYEYAATQSDRVFDELDYWGDRKLATVDKPIWKHEIEWHKKFALSFACIIFFFIGAPLGAIIRKGGFGLPVVVSVLLFIIYYIVDNMGFKFARAGTWPAWAGTWLSSAMLFPLGIFLTYKAAIDATVNLPSWDSIKAKWKARGKKVKEVSKRLNREDDNQNKIITIE